MRSDKETLNFLSSILLSKRGYITKLKKGDGVVSIVSGGLDSTIATSIAIEKYGLEVFPIFVRRGQRNLIFEERAVKFFDGFFLDRYPSSYNPVFIVDFENPPKTFKDFYINNKSGHPMRNSILENVGIQYAVSLESINKKIRTVIISTTKDDIFPHSQLEALRAQTINACVHNDDWTWQITSIFKDSVLDQIFSKSDLILWALERGIPLEQTRSCVSASEVPCGKCIGCSHRTAAFKELSLRDSVYGLQKIAEVGATAR